MLKKAVRSKWAVLLVVLLLAGCGGGEDETKEKASDSPAVEEKEKPAEETTAEPQYEETFPLTGKGTNEDVSSRVVGVMINNHPKARPQSGLHKADVVYEVLAEGYVTRFLAMFHSQQPEVIGPVRSARDYYINLSNGFNAIYVCHGFSPEAQVMLNKQNVADDLNGLYYDGSLFKRADFRRAPHNSYITYENIEKGAKKNDYALTDEVKPLPFLTKSELSSLDGQTAKDIMITYSNTNTVSYTYDEQTSMYQRYSSGEKTVDRETKIPIQLDNVLIVEAPHQVIDNAGRREIDLKAGGQGYLLQRGVLQEVTWKNVNGRILPYKDGQQMGLVPGKTWINIIPTSPGLSGAVSMQSE
ncbi:DUF3048 domain-containing protein [Bacillus tianshenii]|nr:DUF3048 domain-containing protein [Bacillus tianshenii]